MVKVRDEVISIKNVPAYICEECGDAYYSPEVSKKIDRVMRDFHEKRLLAHPIAAGELDLNEVASAL